MSTSILNFIKDQIDNNDIVLFMKGTKEKPMCGFSAYVVDILYKLNTTFICINVLESNDLRQGIKEFSQWPTLPQLYVKREFIGGYDIVRELYNNNDLIPLLTQKNILIK